MDSFEICVKIDANHFKWEAKWGCREGVQGGCRGGAGGLSELGGTPKWRQEAKMIKRGGPSNSFAVFLTIFEENGLQDGGRNRQEFDKKVIQNLIIF